MIAHGGVAGAIAETLVAVAVILVLGAVWIRERQAGGEGEPEVLSDEEPPFS